MIEIFVSYRQADRRTAGGLVKERLEEEFGETIVFFDVKNLQASKNWKEDIKDALNTCRVMVVVIGPDWATIEKDGRKRLFIDDDTVRFEVETGLQHHLGSMTVVPVLVDGARMPDERDLPTSISALPGVQAARDLEELIKTILKAPTLPPDARARRNARYRDRGQRFGCVIHYDLLGLDRAYEETERNWSGDRTFREIATQTLLLTREWVKRRFKERMSLPDVRVHVEDLPAGGFLVFEPPEPDAQRCVRLCAEEAAKLCQDYKDLFEGYAPRGPTGLHWPVDVRFAIAAGQVFRASGRNADGDAAVAYAGPPILNAQKALYLTSESGPIVKRGEVLVWPGESSFKADDFEPDVENRRFDVELSKQRRYVFRRDPPLDTSFQIPEHITKALTDHTLTTDEKATDLLLHVPPSNYCAGARLPEGETAIATLAKAGQRFCIITGPPGLGKTLCALRIVAELMHIDRIEPSVPPVAPETWEKLKSSDLGSRRVIFLDDAFGKTHLVAKELRTALQSLGSPVTQNAEDLDDSFFARPAHKRPFLIITMRDDIWKAASALDDADWEARFGPFRAPIRNEQYTKELRLSIFDKHWKDARGEKTEGYELLSNEAATAILHPLSLRDFARENASKSIDQARAAISRFKGDALTRLISEIEGRTPDRARQLHHFFAWVFGGGVRDDEVLKGVFRKVCACLDDRDAAAKSASVWDDQRKTSWGEWKENGVFWADHPLREEAVHAFFSDESDERRTLVERFFSAFNIACRDDGEMQDIAALTAYAAARVPGWMGPARRAAIERAVANPNGAPARSFASAAGQTWRRALNTPPGASGLGETRQTLRDKVAKLLQNPKMKSFGVAFAALCDSYSGDETKDKELATLEQQAIRYLEEALKPQIRTEGGGVKEDQIRVQNIEHAVWALASNYHRLSRPLRKVLRSIAENSKGQEWFRLRALEAIADYYVPIIREEEKPGGTAAWPYNLVNDSVRVEHTIAYRRGAIGAWEANFDRIDEVEQEHDRRSIVEWLKDELDTARLVRHGDGGLGFLEWSIWVAGEHFEKLDKSKFESVLRRLSSHEDVRVRKWLTTALAESAKTRERTDLRQFLTTLARDDDDVVRGQAVDFFLASE